MDAETLTNPILGAGEIGVCAPLEQKHRDPVGPFSFDTPHREETRQPVLATWSIRSKNEHR
jgi:hypothetical protein